MGRNVEKTQRQNLSSIINNMQLDTPKTRKIGEDKSEKKIYQMKGTVDLILKVTTTSPEKNRAHRKNSNFTHKQKKNV